MTPTWDFQRLARTTLIIGVVFLGVWMLWRFLPALAWAGVLAIATWPLRNMLARRGLGETGIASLLTLVLALVLVLPLIGIGMEVAHDRAAIVEWIRNVNTNGFGSLEILRRLPYVGTMAADWWDAHLAQPGAARALLGRTGSLLPITRLLGLEVASRLTILIFTVLALFFLYRDAPALMRDATSVGEQLFGPTGRRLGQNVIAAVRGTVNGLVLVGLAEGVLLGIAYAATGLAHHAVLLGLVTGVLATIPFGAPVVFILCAIYLFAYGQATGAIILLVAGSVVVFIADHFVRPILIGSSTRLPFLWVLLGIFGGLETFGLIGLFLGPAIMSVLIALWREASVPAE